MIDAGEAICLVGEGVEEEGVVGRYGVDEVGGVGFVEFEDGDVGVEFAAEGDFV